MPERAQLAQQLLHVGSALLACRLQQICLQRLRVVQYPTQQDVRGRLVARAVPFGQHPHGLPCRAVNRGRHQIVPPAASLAKREELLVADRKIRAAQGPNHRNLVQRVVNCPQQGQRFPYLLCDVEVPSSHDPVRYAAFVKCLFVYGHVGQSAEQARDIPVAEGRPWQSSPLCPHQRLNAERQAPGLMSACLLRRVHPLRDTGGRAESKDAGRSFTLRPFARRGRKVHVSGLVDALSLGSLEYACKQIVESFQQ